MGGRLENMSWGTIFDALQWLFTAVIGLVVWLRKPGEDAGKAVADVASRVLVIEERHKHMPTSEELADLAGTVKALQTEVGGVRESQGSIKSQLNRIESFLLSNK